MQAEAQQNVHYSKQRTGSSGLGSKGPPKPEGPRPKQQPYRRSPTNAEDPYDARAEYFGSEDPTIREMTADEEEKKTVAAEEEETSTARKLIGAFDCGVYGEEEDNVAVAVTKNAHYDHGYAEVDEYELESRSFVGGEDDASCGLGAAAMVCAPFGAAVGSSEQLTRRDAINRKRKLYDDKFTALFLKEAIQTGIPLLHHQPPTDPDSDTDDWTGSTVKMSIRPGNCHGVHVVQPKLQWLTLGRSVTSAGRAVVSRSTVTRVDLTDIYSIVASSVDEEEDDNDITNDIPLHQQQQQQQPPQEDTLFFSLTTNTGDFYVFEAMTLTERDRIVQGLRNVVSWLSRMVILGNTTVCEQLFNEDEEEYGLMSGELPSLKTSVQAMNAISHSFLNAMSHSFLD